MTGSPRNTEPNNLSRYVGSMLSVCSGLVLVRSAMFHLGNPFGFLATVYSYEILPKWAGVIVAAVLPATQLVLGLMLVLFPQHRRASLKLSGVLFLLLAVVQIMTLVRGLNITCGCFGPSIEDNPIGPYSIGLAFVCCVVSFIGNRLLPVEDTPSAKDASSSANSHPRTLTPPNSAPSDLAD